MKSWPTKKLGEICDLERGTEPGSAFYTEASNKSIPFLRVGDLTGKVDAKRFVKKSNNNLQVVNKNETLITFDGTPGIVVRGFSGAIASGIRVIRNLKPEINGDFLFYYLQTPVVQKTIKAYSKGATIIHASAAIPHIKISLPPLKIQKQIVGRLDKIAEAQKLNDELIQKADELFQSLLHKEIQSQKGWETKKLEEIVDINYGKGLEKSYRKENGKYYAYGSNGPVYRTDKILIEELTIIVGRKGGAGLLWMTEEPSWPIDTTFYLRVKDRSNTDLNFLYFSLQTKNLPKLAIVTAVPGINRSTLYNVKISLPPLKIQKQIVEKLSAVQNYKKKLLEQKQKLQELFESVLNKSFKEGL